MGALKGRSRLEIKFPPRKSCSFQTSRKNYGDGIEHQVKRSKTISW